MIMLTPKEPDIIFPESYAESARILRIWVLDIERFRRELMAAIENAPRRRVFTRLK